MFQITTVSSMPLKPGAADCLVFGQEAVVVDGEGNELPAGKEGFLVLKDAWPAMAPCIRMRTALIFVDMSPKPSRRL